MPYSRGSMLWFCVVVGANALTSTGLAQTGTFFPPGIVLSNYNRVQVGQEEALESGAYVARVNGATSSWYNPAGLVLVTNTDLSASASGYQLNSVSLEGRRTTAGSSEIKGLPNFVGFVLGRDFFKSDKVALGFSMTTPIAWNENINTDAATDVANGRARLDYLAKGHIFEIRPAVSASWAPFGATGPLRLGATLGLAMTSINETQSLGVQVAGSTAANAGLRTLEASGSAWHLVPGIGAQWEVTKNVILGGLFTVPGIRVNSGGSITFAEIRNNGSPWSQLYLRDDNATFNYKIPLNATAGLAWRNDDWQAEVDFRYYGSASNYPIFQSPQPLQITTTDSATGAPVYSQQGHTFPVNGSREVLNVAVGGSYMLNEHWSLHGGFRTDTSPSTQESQTLFRRVDIYGITLGAKLQGHNLSGSLGVSYDWGSSEVINFTDSGTGQEASTRLLLRSITLLYSIAFKS